MTSRDYAALAALAARQQSCFHRDQAAAFGFDHFTLRREVQSGRLAMVAPDVGRFSGVAPSLLADLWAGHLASGGIVTHEACAEVRNIEGLPRGRGVLTVAHASFRRVGGLVVHQTRDPWPIEHEMIDGLPVSSARRMLLDAAAITTPARYRHVFQSALIARQTTVEEVSVLAGEIMRPGKRGRRLVLATIDELAGPPSSQSFLEVRLHEMIASAGLPPLRRQAPLPGRQDVKGCVDGDWLDALLIVEVDGRRWHARHSQMALDRERDGQAAEAGYLTHRVMHEHLVSDPEGCASRLGVIRQMRLTQLGRSSTSRPAGESRSA